MPHLAFEMVRQAGNGKSRFQIRLDPPELGRIDVHMHVDNAGNVSARMTVDKAETLDLLQRDQSSLEKALAQAGLDGNKPSLEFSLRQNPFARPDGGQQQPGGQRTFNGGGSEDWKSDHGTSTDPLANQLVADKSSYRWVNHTYLHPFLGCVQDVGVVPWRCETTSTGATQWVSKADITAAVKDNRSWAASHGIPLNNQELVTGEHSGLKVLPQQPADNPNLAPALSGLGVAYLASDDWFAGPQWAQADQRPSALAPGGSTPVRWTGAKPIMLGMLPRRDPMNQPGAGDCRRAAAEGEISSADGSRLSPWGRRRT